MTSAETLDENKKNKDAFKESLHIKDINTHDSTKVIKDEKFIYRN